MVIGRNADWGSPADAVRRAVAHDDASVVRLQGPVAPRTSGGNLHRALGSPAPPAGVSAGVELTIDALEVTVTVRGGTLVVRACAEVVIGSWFSRHGFVLVTNVGMWNGLDAAPGGHPNDGRFEVVELRAGMTLRDRTAARRRARTGNHVPHPFINTRTEQTFSASRLGHQRLWIDSVPVPGWLDVNVVLRPDALRVVV
ncbi:MAG: hypothetical protein RLZZ305_1068 [Actinomycetota bacterium]